MLIECLIKREGPTTLDLDKARITFADNGTGRFVADVQSTDHQRRLLSLKRFYRPYNATEEPVEETVSQQAPPVPGENATDRLNMAILNAYEDGTKDPAAIAAEVGCKTDYVKDLLKIAYKKPDKFEAFNAEKHTEVVIREYNMGKAPGAIAVSLQDHGIKGNAVTIGKLLKELRNAGKIDK